MAVLSDCQKTCSVTGIGGKDSVKGNRQGSLSRSITRRSDQNRKIKYCFLFCGFASACQKSLSLRASPQTGVAIRFQSA